MTTHSGIPDQQWIAQGLAHARAREFDAAQACFERVLGENPRHADALHLMGSVAQQAGRPGEALGYIDRALAVNANVWAFHHNRGEVLRSLERLPEAVEAYQTALRLNPLHVEAHLALALVHEGAGALDEAAGHFWRAVTLRPQAHICHRLGILLCRLGRLDEAVSMLRQALALAPADARARHDLAVALAGAGILPAAAEELRQAVAIDPKFLAAQLRLGMVGFRLGLLEEAQAAFTAAAQLDPASVAATDGLAQVLERRGDIAGAVAAHRLAIERHGASAVHDFYLASLGAADAPAAAPQNFVVDLFDGYAEQFDAHLALLQYRTPQLLFDAVVAARGHAPADVLDLGCGTGLVGTLLAPLARTLTGVDLSPGMIEKARQRKIYDELLVGELAQVLGSYVGAFDLIVAADVFCYLGDLSSVFARSHAALRPGGHFAFSVEAMDGGSFALARTRRYTHSLAYLRELATAQDYREHSAATVSLRRQGQEDVAGFLVVLQRATV